jgi:Ribonuclease G/E
MEPLYQWMVGDSAASSEAPGSMVLGVGGCQEAALSPEGSAAGAPVGGELGVAVDEQRVVRVRVRGIYATALTQLILDKGFQVVQASRIIADRFGIPQLDLPADVTLKNSDEDPSEILVVGYTWAAQRVLEALREELPYSFYWVSRLPLHSTVKAVVVGVEGGRCVVEVNGVRAVLQPESQGCPAGGGEVVAGVKRPGVKPGEEPVLVPGARVIGDYAIVYETQRPRVTISEHVRGGEKRAELMSIAADYTARGLGVHWRSSSRYADAETLRNELEALARKLEEVRKNAGEGPPGVYSEGELVALIRLSSVDKATLDRLRARTTPTAPLHNSLKSNAPQLSDVVDFAEKLIPHGVGEEQLLAGILDFLADRLQAAKNTELVHAKPDGSLIKLGPAAVVNVESRGSRLVVVLERRVRSRGVYDGLGVEKEPGDRIVTEIDTGSWTLVHKYYSRDGRYKGTYININTPPEPGPDHLAYLDLEVDIVKLPTGEKRVIDLEQLEKARQEGVITEKLYQKVIEVLAEHGYSPPKAS